ncbi:putative phenazine biosynthesis-like protein [Actinoplanes missouriensis 431]|uniref:Putative phenazine biosynthesis-like protein n=1 Tax=Actinoplanes missouriensis (strain ATCC 14538 / DSM 43046 / CBS 188.64 / JCM 3121 / NBRC 102363 / NCIMB 12654 / NRRL B-3342 / UNCC 431) TaxID=512565 RepID=I0HID8_ACTM4|nr:PhzF family phenazine biosynthesis protein [Actinoplanes missouriensis]BAL92775.1 putative phenazine biosynthesis-like protein [Actinoplanes missouriensis 431]
MSTVAYEIVDVFTDRPYAGNPLAVVHGAEGLAPDQMLTLAREFNLAETVFVLPPAAPGATYRVRIFTTETELPFAGHPSVGAAVTLMRRGDFPPGDVVQECGAGLLPVSVTAAGSATLTGGTPTLGDPLEPAPLLEAVGLSAADLAPAAPRSAGCGLPWTFLPVRREALARAALNPMVAGTHGVTGLTVFSWSQPSSPEPSSPASVAEAHARVFVPGEAVWEDPATGSAALGLGVWLVATGWLPGEGTSSYRVHQGHEIRRPSLLECTVTATGGTATSATVTGHVVPIARGEIAVPPFVG